MAFGVGSEIELVNGTKAVVVFWIRIAKEDFIGGENRVLIQEKESKDIRLIAPREIVGFKPYDPLEALPWYEYLWQAIKSRAKCSA